jgi:ribosomal protein L27
MRQNGPRYIPGKMSGLAAITPSLRSIDGIVKFDVAGDKKRANVYPVE